MPKKSSKNLPIYEYDKKVNGQTRYYIRPYVNGKQTTYRLDENGNMWLGRDGYQEACNYCVNLNTKTIDSKSNTDKTFKELFYEMQEYDKIHNNNSLSTRSEYERCMLYNIFPLKISNIPLKKWCKENYTNEIIKPLLDHTIENGIKKGKNYQTKTINKILMIISKVFKYSMLFYDIKENIVVKVGFLKENKDKIPEITLDTLIKQNKTISDDEWAHFVDTVDMIISNECDNGKKVLYQELLTMFTCEYVLLLRIGEVQAMKWQYFRKNLYLLKEQWNKRLSQLTPIKNREARIIYIPDKLLQIIENLRALKHLEFDSDEFVFGGANVLPRTTIDRYRRIWCKKANIKYFTNHFLRHAGESYALAQQVDPIALATMAGHTKQVMFENYIDSLETSNKYLVDVLNKISVPKSI